MAIRDGVLPWISGKLPNHKARTNNPSDSAKKLQIQSKVNKIRMTQYIDQGPMILSIDVFDVPKGDEDIRLVNNGTSCGLNDVMWAPWFPLPTVNTHLRGVEAGTSMADLDVSDHFHNFMIHQTIQPYVGVNFTNYPRNQKLDEMPIWDIKWDESRCETLGERFNRNCMGLVSSAYNSVQGLHWAEETVSK